MDKAAKANLTNRSSYVRQAITMRLKDERIVSNPRTDDVLEFLKQV